MADGEDVYCTLVMNDAYLPGAAVLAHSLRDCGTKKKLACLIVQDGLRPSSIEELQSLYNYVIPIERIGNPHPGNLYLMNRPDLLFAFTKIHLWRQVQFRKIVYIDADVVALRAPEELFDLPDAFAAAPDVGWPDAFNSGVMVLSPDMGEYYALRGLASSGDSFDGADQGLLNQYFEHRPWKRLSFTYNTTPSANYQYEPAYRYWKRNITLVHFIGKDKPWQRGRVEQGAPTAFNEMLSRWWAVYDRHFRVSTNEYIHGQRNPIAAFVTEHKSAPVQTYSATGYPVATTEPAPAPHHAPGTATPSFMEPGEPAENLDQGRQAPATTSEQRKFSAPHMEWDATRGAPPMDARPEAANFPNTTYEFNTNPELFRPPPSYPEPPKDMYYQVPPPAQRSHAEERPKPIFPWEERDDVRPTRRFVEDEPLPSPPPDLEPENPYVDELEVTSDDKFEPATPTIKINDDPWAAFAQNRNAWDDVSGINDYVRALTSFQKNRGKVQVVQENTPATAQHHVMSPTTEIEADDLLGKVDKARERRESLILTDFPSAIERPSLPVTPAPRRRSTFWGDEGRDDEAELPPAEGVPDQADWDPNLQLEQLRRNSLIGPGDLKFPEKKFARRTMPSSAVPIPEHALAHPHVPIANVGDGTDERGRQQEQQQIERVAGVIGGGSSHGLGLSSESNQNEHTHAIGSSSHEQQNVRFDPGAESSFFNSSHESNAQTTSHTTSSEESSSDQRNDSPEGTRTTSAFFDGSSESAVHQNRNKSRSFLANVFSTNTTEMSETERNTALNAATGTTLSDTILESDIPVPVPGRFPTGEIEADPGSFFSQSGSSTQNQSSSFFSSSSSSEQTGSSSFFGQSGSGEGGSFFGGRSGLDVAASAVDEVEAKHDGKDFPGMPEAST